jgi:hypothetical protein
LYGGVYQTSFVGLPQESLKFIRTNHVNTAGGPTGKNPLGTNPWYIQPLFLAPKTHKG